MHYTKLYLTDKINQWSSPRQSSKVIHKNQWGTQCEPLIIFWGLAFWIPLAYLKEAQFTGGNMVGVGDSLKWKVNQVWSLLGGLLSLQSCQDLCAWACVDDPNLQGGEACVWTLNLNFICDKYHVLYHEVGTKGSEVVLEKPQEWKVKKEKTTTHYILYFDYGWR